MRKPDTSKGDKLKVELICPLCRDPGIIYSNEAPKYDMEGRYMKKREWCRFCQQSVAYGFVPLDCPVKSISCRQICDHTIRGARPRHRQAGPQSREDLSIMTARGLQCWIGSQGYSVSKESKERSHILIVAHRICGSVSKSTPQAAPASERGVGPVGPHRRRNIEGMTSKDLTSWIHAKGVAIGRKSKTKPDLIKLAKRIWNSAGPNQLAQFQRAHLRTQGVVVVHGPRARNELLAPSSADLRSWLVSKGLVVGYSTKSGGLRPSREELLRGAECVFDNPEDLLQANWSTFHTPLSTVYRKISK